jgi:hypothetical protein
MVLNEALDFATARTDVKRAFLRPPQRILVADGTRLYRWSDRPLTVGDIAPWWLFVESRPLPNGELFEGFRVAEERARRLGRSHREYDRARLALSEKFDNAMTKLLLVTMNVPAWGFAGQASGQHEFKDKRLDHVFLIGGAHQLWIPGLDYTHLRKEAVVG